MSIICQGCINYNHYAADCFDCPVCKKEMGLSEPNKQNKGNKKED